MKHWKCSSKVHQTCILHSLIAEKDERNSWQIRSSNLLFGLFILFVSFINLSLVSIFHSNVFFFDIQCMYGYALLSSIIDRCAYYNLTSDYFENVHRFFSSCFDNSLGRERERDQNELRIHLIIIYLYICVRDFDHCSYDMPWESKRNQFSFGCISSAETESLDGISTTLAELWLLKWWIVCAFWNSQRTLTDWN